MPRHYVFGSQYHHRPSSSKYASKMIRYLVVDKQASLILPQITTFVLRTRKVNIHDLRTSSKYTDQSPRGLEHWVVPTSVMSHTPHPEALVD